MALHKHVSFCLPSKLSFASTCLSALFVFVLIFTSLKREVRNLVWKTYFGETEPCRELVGTLLEPCRDLVTVFLVNRKERRNLVGTLSAKTKGKQDLVGILFGPCRDLITVSFLIAGKAGTLSEPLQPCRWKVVRTLLGPCHATLLDLSEPCHPNAEKARTLSEPYRNLASSGKKSDLELAQF